MNGIGLGFTDLGIIFVYLAGIVIYGISKGRKSGTEEYFLAGRSITWPVIGISLFAANIGSNTLIGLASDAYQTNVAVYNYEWMAAVVLVFFAIFFLPFYIRSKVFTMPEFLERRFDRRSRFLFSGITVIGNIFIDMASGLYAGNLILKIVFPGMESWMIIAILAATAAVYTIPGGLSSVLHTEVIQAVVLIAGSVILTWFCFEAVGGWEGMISGIDSLQPGGKNSAEVLSLVKPAGDPWLPWPGLVFGVPLLGFYFWATNQFMVQRVLSARNLNHGRWGALFAGLLKLPVLFIMVIPGVIAYVLFHDLDISFLNYTLAGSHELCTGLDDCPNMAYPVLVYKLLPSGVLGLVIAGLLAAMSSSLSATLNSASTLITMDFVTAMRPSVTSRQLVRAGQTATVILVIIAAAWAPMIESVASSLWEYLQMVLAYIAPPIVATFMIGLFYKRGNADGAFYGLLISYSLVIFYIIMKWFDLIPRAGSLHFLIQVPILAIICAVLNILISNLTVPPPEARVNGLTWNRQVYITESRELKSEPWYRNYRVLSVLLLILTATLVIWFW